MFKIEGEDDDNTITAGDYNQATVQALAFSIVGGNDDGAFEIEAIGSLTDRRVSAQLKIKDASKLNFEAQNSYTLTVQLLDLTGRKAQADYTVSVFNGNDAPILGDLSLSVGEQATKNTAVGVALVAQDDDSGCLSTACSNDKWGAVSYTITQLQDKDGNAITNNLFDIVLGAANTAQITIKDIGTSEIRDMNKVSGCVETTPGVSKICENRKYTLKVTATDGFERPASAAPNGYGLLSQGTNVAKTSNTATITVTLTEQNNAPVMVCPSTLTIDENTTPGSNVVSGVITASDQEGDAIAYSITSGNDLDAFSVVGSDGGTKGTILVNKDVINFEGGRQVYSLAIKAEDQVAQPLSSSCTVTINVNDLNEGPLLADVALSVTENSAAGVQVGSTTMLAVSSDVDAADNVPKALQFSIVPDAGCYGDDALCVTRVHSADCRGAANAAVAYS